MAAWRGSRPRVLERSRPRGAHRPPAARSGTASRRRCRQTPGGGRRTRAARSARSAAALERRSPSPRTRGRLIRRRLADVPLLVAARDVLGDRVLGDDPEVAGLAALARLARREDREVDVAHGAQRRYVARLHVLDEEG